MALNKGDHAWKFTQALRQCDHAEQRRSADGERPQRIDPSASQPYSWENSLLRWHPVIETNAIVCITETGAQWLW